jgi:hypothetical protein
MSFAGRQEASNRWKVVGGFRTGFSKQQREAICAYLKGVRSMLDDAIDPENQQLLDEAEAIWALSVQQPRGD